jgi:hypothetical protein
MFQQAVDHAGPVEPGGDGEPPGHCRGLEPADFLHPPDVQLEVRPARGERVHATFRAPEKVATQVGLGVIPEGALKTGQVGRHRQPQLISERRQRMRRDGRQIGEGPHAPDTARVSPRREAQKVPSAADEEFSRVRHCLI